MATRQSFGVLKRDYEYFDTSKKEVVVKKGTKYYPYVKLEHTYWPAFLSYTETHPLQYYANGKVHCSVLTIEDTTISAFDEYSLSSFEAAEHVVKVYQTTLGIKLNNEYVEIPL
jgi:hypothetical protein